ncbi:MAG TPA: hypothetical protein VF798_16130 [Burkholderiaceae bacterium]
MRIGNIHYIEHLFWIMDFAKRIENRDCSANFPEGKIEALIQTKILPSAHEAGGAGSKPAANHQNEHQERGTTP